MQRSILLLASILCLLAGTTGCMVIDEVDKAAELLEATPSAEASDAAGTSGGAAQENPLLRESKQWWKQATSLSSEGIDTRIVQCRLDGSSQYMSLDDCQSRGGVPKGV